MSFKIQLLEISPQKQKEQKQKQLDADRLVTTQDWKLNNLMSLFSDVFSLPVNFEYKQHLNHEFYNKHIYLKRL